MQKDGLTPEQRRNLPHPKDIVIEVEGHAKLTIGFIIGYEQTKLKVKDHGAIRDVPYTIDKKGEPKSLRTEENIDKFRKSIVKRVTDKGNYMRWFVNGSYQGGTRLGYPAILVFNEETKDLEVFKRVTNTDTDDPSSYDISFKLNEIEGEFVTSCNLEDHERTELLRTGNFVCI